MAKIKTSNRGRVQKNAGAQTKYFGLVTAVIDQDKQRIELKWAPRHKDPLGDGHRQRCLGWALSALAEYTDQGYAITVPEAVPNG